MSSTAEKKDADFKKIDWYAPGSEDGEAVSSKNATLALKTAIAVARAFDANCVLRNPRKECTVPMFEPQELVLGETLRSSGFFIDMHLRGIRLTKELLHGDFSEEEEEYRERFAERSADGFYAVKYLQKGVYSSVHAASAAADFMMETKILMNLAPHPNCVQIYGVTAAGSDAFLSRGREGFYIIVDRLSSTLLQRLNFWREERQENIGSMIEKGEDTVAIAKAEYKKQMERLEAALDIASALLFLSDRQIVYNIRPEKVGFDARYQQIKLCDFGQARENGQIDQAPSLIKTDDIRTLAYTAPEVLCQAPVTVSADVYAFGVLLFEMLSLECPMDGMSRSEHFEKVVINGARPAFPESFPKIIKQLVEHCWNAHLRPTMKRVYETIEELLLFQDDAPDFSTVRVLLPPHVGKPKVSESTEPKPKMHSKKESQDVAEGNSTVIKSLRRQKTEESTITRQGTQKTSNQRRTSGRAAHEATPDGDHAPDSPRKNGDKSSKAKDRVSRKTRIKKASGHESQNTVDAENAFHNGSSSNIIHKYNDDSERSLEELLQTGEQEEAEQSMKAATSSQQKLNYKASQSMSAISAVEDAKIETKPSHSSFSGTEQKAHRSRRKKKN